MNEGIERNLLCFILRFYSLAMPSAHSLLATCSREYSPIPKTNNTRQCSNLGETIFNEANSQYFIPPRTEFLLI